jgi:hypothetical protein
MDARPIATDALDRIAELQLLSYIRLLRVAYNRYRNEPQWFFARLFLIGPVT